MKPFAQSSPPIGRALVAFGTIFLTIAIVLTFNQSRTADAERLLELTNAAESESRSLTRYLDNAATTLKLTASDRAFTDILSDDPAIVDEARPEVHNALSVVHSLYPRAIGEACVITNTGRELARIVKSSLAPLDDLGDDEAGTPFFALGLVSEPGTATHSGVYRSPDTNEWVVSIVSGLRNGDARSFLHLELTLESVRDSLTSPRSELDVDLVDLRTGETLIRAGEPTSVGRNAALDRKYAPVVSSFRSSSRGAVEVQGSTVGFRHVDLADQSERDWAVVVSNDAGSSGPLGHIGLDSLAFFIAGLCLCVFSARSSKLHRAGLHRAATTDQLTGLPNRSMLFGEAVERVAAANASSRAAVLLIDLDGFKAINDTLGHHQGDLLLAAVGPRLRSALRPDDFIARIGGDEFVVVSTGIESPDGGRLIADRLRGVLLEPFVLDDMVHEVSASIGISTAPNDGSNLDELLNKADIAMYAAKDQRLGVAEYDESLAEQASGRVTMMSELQRGLERGEMVLYYQPLVELQTGALVGMEALIRWAHPERGLVPPVEFIPIAEMTPLIHNLTAWTLDVALAQQRQWATQGHDLVVSVNVSARCLSDPNLRTRVADLLERHSVQPQFLKLEVTESAIMGDPLRSREVLRDLQRLGVALSVDDFGTGYSSLAYLRDLAVDELKIDRSFVSALGSSDADELIVAAIIDLGRNLGLSMVAEGIEDEAALARLTELGFHTGQGFLWSKPVPPAEFELLFSKLDHVHVPG